MKHKKLFLAVLAAVLILTASIGSAAAYFTASVTAKGSAPVKISNETTITERVTQQSKFLTIDNEGDSPVYVRARGFSGLEYPLSYSGENWVGPDADGFYRYTIPVMPGESTGDELQISITFPTDDVDEGDSFNVEVVYESTLALLGDNGEYDMEASWAAGGWTVIS
ncbi:MAG: hypothetical protein IJ594_01075 [Oscillospiraceae bacterium]|nr:hypothetical protein [Oscillospiraceae bacterium]